MFIFFGLRFICSPYLAIKSVVASLGPLMARCGPQMNLYALKMNIVILHIRKEVQSRVQKSKISQTSNEKLGDSKLIQIKEKVKGSGTLQGLLRP